MKKPSPTLCPECSEPVYRKGVTWSGNGKMRYAHLKSQRLPCSWHGTAPVGLEAAKATGVSPAQSRLLKQAIIRNHKKPMRYVITSAQNATPIHEEGFKSLLTYCKTNDAALLVIPYRYKNPTSMWSKKGQADDWWASDLLPYLINLRVDLNDNLVLLADIMTQPTARRPLEGYETITGGQSAIVGHPKLELIAIPTPQQKLPKLLTTTGSITQKNYIPSKAGKQGEHHHTYGACVVEVTGKIFHIRQLNMKTDGSFCDLLTEYRGDETRTYDRIPALVMGDTHVNLTDPSVTYATFASAGALVKMLRPEVLVWHDVHDGTAKNHHDRGKPFHELVKYQAGQDNVRKEVEKTLEYIDAFTPPATKNIIVPSNHHDFLREWVENTDPRRDPENCVFWAETFKAIATSENTRWTPGGVAVQDPFAYWGEKTLKCAKRTTFLRRDQSYTVRGIEVAHHGDKGPNGARGSRTGFSKIGVKTIIGHTHTPGISDGCYQVGTNSYLNLTYAAGSPSSWLHTDCVIYPNGKRSLINIIDGKWRA